jgi:hypothetical protein
MLSAAECEYEPKPGLLKKKSYLEGGDGGREGVREGGREGEREGMERGREGGRNLNTHAAEGVSGYAYIYIYIYRDVCISESTFPKCGMCTRTHLRRTR